MNTDLKMEFKRITVYRNFLIFGGSRQADLHDSSEACQKIWKKMNDCNYFQCAKLDEHICLKKLTDRACLKITNKSADKQLDYLKD